MHAVLVINATYEPLSTTKLSRAVVLVSRGDAEVHEAIEGRVLRHKNGEMVWPKVIRLLRYVKVSMEYRPAGWSKHGVLKRDDWTCAYCDKHATTVDHILPLSQKGGERDWLNTVASCLTCNAKKRNRTPQQAHMTLLITPSIPHVMRIRLGNAKVRRHAGR